MRKAYHVCCFGSRDREFQIRIFLPVSKEQRELCEKSIVDASYGCNGLGVGIAVDASFKRLCGANQFFPCLEVIGVIGLGRVFVSKALYSYISHGSFSMPYQVSLELSQLRVFLFGASVGVIRHGRQLYPYSALEINN